MGSVHVAYTPFWPPHIGLIDWFNFSHHISILSTFAPLNKIVPNKPKQNHCVSEQQTHCGVELILFIFKLLLFSCEWFNDSLTCQHILYCHNNVTCRKSHWKIQNVQTQSSGRLYSENSQWCELNISQLGLKTGTNCNDVKYLHSLS